jgi:hypothetical protein
MNAFPGTRLEISAFKTPAEMQSIFINRNAGTPKRIANHSSSSIEICEIFIRPRCGCVDFARGAFTNP